MCTWCCPQSVQEALISRVAPSRWADEFKKFAPGLVVHTYYASSKNKSKAIEGLRDADVLITTPHMNIGEAFLARVRLHRLVLDEAHLLNPGSSTAQKLGSLMRYQAKYAWCVTGTPFSTSLRQLLPQAKLLGQDEAGIGVNDLVNGRKRAGWVPPSSSSMWKNHWPRDTVKNDEITTLLRTVMIRHTKAMRIGGAVALALPDADVQTLWLDVCPTLTLTLPLTPTPTPDPNPNPNPNQMSDDERRLYQLHGCADGGQYMLEEDHQRLKACSHLYAPGVVCGKSSSFRSQQGPGAGGGPSKPLSHAEREALSLKSPAPYGQHAEATATFLRLHTHSVEPAPKLGARERRIQAARAARVADGGADEDAVGSPATVDVYTPNANLTKFRALLTELTELHGGLWTHPAPVSCPASCPLPPAPCPLPPAPCPLAPACCLQGGRGTAEGLRPRPNRHGLQRAPRLDAAYRRSAPPSLQHTRLAQAPAVKVPPPPKDPPPPGFIRYKAEPAMRVVIFTRHDRIQKRLVQVISDATHGDGCLAPPAAASSKGKATEKVRLFEFNAATPPTKRHRLIHDFQAPGEGARLFIVTYATAAVGITLTAASRVYLMEPTLDPAQELQAAGRIHRLGQTRDVFIRRFAVCRTGLEPRPTRLQPRTSRPAILTRSGLASVPRQHRGGGDGAAREDQDARDCADRRPLPHGGTRALPHARRAQSARLLGSSARVQGELRQRARHRQLLLVGLWLRAARL